jgi:hypothetical protein
MRHGRVHPAWVTSVRGVWAQVSQGHAAGSCRRAADDLDDLRISAEGGFMTTTTEMTAAAEDELLASLMSRHEE